MTIVRSVSIALLFLLVALAASPVKGAAVFSGAGTIRGVYYNGAGELRDCAIEVTLSFVEHDGAGALFIKHLTANGNAMPACEVNSARGFNIFSNAIPSAGIFTQDGFLQTDSASWTFYGTHADGCGSQYRAVITFDFFSAHYLEEHWCPSFLPWASFFGEVMGGDAVI